MNHKRTFGLLLLYLLLLGALPAAAQESGGWFVYLFDSINNALIRVDDSGAMARYPLGLAGDEFANSSDMAVSDDGRLLAFCKMQLSGQDATGRTLIVREVASETRLLEMAIDPAYSGCRPSGFDRGGTRLVLGLAAELGFDTDSGQPVQRVSPGWRLQVLDVSSGAVLHELNSETPNAPMLDDFGRGMPVPLMADMLSFQGDALVFRGWPYIGTEAPAELPAWRWNLGTGEISPVANIGRLKSDYLLATGELAYPALDETRPAAEPGGPLPQANMVIVQTPDDSSQAVYRNAEEVIVAAQFVDDGRALGISLLEGFDMENPSDTFTMRHILLDRSGKVTDVGAAYEQYTQLKAVPGGAVIVWAEMATEGAPIAHLGVVEDGTLREIWSYQPPMEGGYSFLELVWTPPVEVEGALPDFAPAQ